MTPTDSHTGFLHSETRAELSENGLFGVSMTGIRQNPGADPEYEEYYLNLDRAGTLRLAKLLGVAPDDLARRLAGALTRKNALVLFRRFCDTHGITYDYGDLSD